MISFRTRRRRGIRIVFQSKNRDARLRALSQDGRQGHRRGYYPPRLGVETANVVTTENRGPAKAAMMIGRLPDPDDRAGGHGARFVQTRVIKAADDDRRSPLRPRLC